MNDIPKSSHLVDPELAYLLSLFAPVPSSSAELPAYREQFRVALSAMPSVPLNLISLPATESNPPIQLRHFKPDKGGSELPAIVHMHGGGYVIGFAAMSDANNYMIAEDLQCHVFSVDYRLAPETRHPDPLEDCYRALKWVYENAEQNDIDSRNIGIKGESAGGGLAAVLALLARDRAEVPILDDRTGSTLESEAHPFAGEYVWTPRQNQFGWNSLLGAMNSRDDVSPVASAARATDLSGLPPTFILVGALDLFLEEDLEYARRLTRAGVPVELHMYCQSCGDGKQ
jgi:acetyl esterase/lipase